MSAPPTEMGKVVLQRMELKSPLTVRQGSVIPFGQTISDQPQQIVQRIQTPVNGTNQYIENNNNNVFQKPTSSINCPPTRNVFLNRAYSEAPRVGYATNGYETDSGITRTGQHSYRNQNVYNNANSNGHQQQQFLVVDNEQEQAYLRNNNGYALSGGSYRNIGNNGYRTIQTPLRQTSSGYETDSGLVKLRQVLDNRRTSSRNNIPIQHQQQQLVPVSNGTAYYYPTNRSITPSFSYAYNQQSIPNHYNSSNLNVANGGATIEQQPIGHTQQYIVTTYPNDIETIDFIDNTEFVQSPVPQFQYTNGNNNNGTMEKISGYIAHDGRPILINDTNQSNIELNNNGLIPQSQSLIIQHQKAPYSKENKNNQTNESNNNDINTNRDTPSRLAQVSNNVTNNIGASNGQLNQSQQLVSKQDSRRSSANSLLAGNFKIFELLN